MEVTAWKYEFMYYLYPEQHEKVLKEINFETKEAKAFKAGWTAGRTEIVEQMKVVIASWM